MKSPARKMGVVRRIAQLERCWLIIELLAPLRNGATTDELRQDAEDILGERFWKRTIHRDLMALQRLGVVERFQVPRPETGALYQRTKWRFRDDSIRSLIHRRAAELRAELRDAG